MFCNHNVYTLTCRPQPPLPVVPQTMGPHSGIYKRVSVNTTDYLAPARRTTQTTVVEGQRMGPKAMFFLGATGADSRWGLMTSARTEEHTFGTIAVEMKCAWTRTARHENKEKDSH